MNTTAVPGLYIQRGVIAPELETSILAWLDQQPWSTVLPRRTQHYGFEYGYKSLKLKPGPPFDGWIKTLGDYLDTNKLLKGADQCIVNEYVSNQGIGKHIDRPQIFSDRIVSFSIGGDCNFIFRNTLNRDEKAELYIPHGSLMIMTGDSRYKWTHEIPKRLSVKNDQGRNVKKPPDFRRVSITYRKSINQ